MLSEFVKRADRIPWWQTATVGFLTGVVAAIVSAVTEWSYWGLWISLYIPTAVAYSWISGAPRTEDSKR